MSQLTDNLNAIASIKSDIAAAIESKGVSMTGVPFGSYADKIGEIQTGGSFVTEPLNVTDNGVYTPGQGVDGYSQVTVNVPQSVTGYTEKDITEKAFTIVNLSNSASYVAANAFQGTNTLQTVNLPECKHVYTYGFESCSSLTEVSLPLCTRFDMGAFRYCRSLSSVYIPECSMLDNGVFSSCTNLQSISLPKCKTIGFYAFSGCKLPSLILPICSMISNYAFANCSNMSMLVLQSTSVCFMTHSVALYNNNCNIYVPSSLVDAYKSANNWSYYSSRIFPIPE